MALQQSGNGNGAAWKGYVIAVLTTALITICTGWVTLGRDVVHKSELREELSTVQTTVKELSTNVAGLTTAVAVLNERLKEKP